MDEEEGGKGCGDAAMLKMARDSVEIVPTRQSGSAVTCTESDAIRSGSSVESSPATLAVVRVLTWHRKRNAQDTAHSTQHTAYSTQLPANGWSLFTHAFFYSIAACAAEKPGCAANSRFRGTETTTCHAFSDNPKAARVKLLYTEMLQESGHDVLEACDRPHRATLVLENSISGA